MYYHTHGTRETPRAQGMSISHQGFPAPEHCSCSAWKHEHKAEARLRAVKASAMQLGCWAGNWRSAARQQRRPLVGHSWVASTCWAVTACHFIHALVRDECSGETRRGRKVAGTRSGFVALCTHCACARSVANRDGDVELFCQRRQRCVSPNHCGCLIAPLVSPEISCHCSQPLHLDGISWVPAVTPHIQPYDECSAE